MKPGDRVTVRPINTRGTITRIHTNTEWIFGRPHHTVWVWVRLDRTGQEHVYFTHELKEDPPMNTDPDTTHEVDPTPPDPQPEPPEPEPEPDEPEPNNDEQPDTKSTRRTVIEDEVELAEWP